MKSLLPILMMDTAPFIWLCLLICFPATIALPIIRSNTTYVSQYELNNTWPTDFRNYERDLQSKEPQTLNILGNKDNSKNVSILYSNIMNRRKPPGRFSKSLEDDDMTSRVARRNRRHREQGFPSELLVHFITGENSTGMAIVRPEVSATDLKAYKADQKGAMLFAVAVVSLYGLSIGLLIGSAVRRDMSHEEVKVFLRKQPRMERIIRRHQKMRAAMVVRQSLSQKESRGPGGHKKQSVPDQQPSVESETNLLQVPDDVRPEVPITRRHSTPSSPYGFVQDYARPACVDPISPACFINRDDVDSPEELWESEEECV